MAKYVCCKGLVKGGLGDMILSLITAISYAKITNRDICVDWRGGNYGMPRDKNIFEKLFKLKNINYYSGMPEYSSVTPSIWTDSMSKFIDDLWKENKLGGYERDKALKLFTADFHNLKKEEEIVVITYFDYFHQLIKPLKEQDIIDKTCSYHQAMGQIFNRHVQFNDETQVLLDRKWERIFGGIKNEKILGVHVRETKESFQVYRPTKRKNYFNKIQHILENDKSVKFIYLATDNLKVQNEFVSKFGDKVLFNKKWFDQPGEALHLSLENCPDKWGNILDAIFDIYALSKCDYLIRRRESSFSALSQCMGLFKDENVEIIDKDLPLKVKLSHWKKKKLNDYGLPDISIHKIKSLF